jgi:hypothetical protein
MFARVAVVMQLVAVLAGSSATASPSSAGHRLSAGYLVSRPIAGDASGLAQTFATGWARLFDSGLEVSLGIELGHSGGEEPLERAALLPGVAWVAMSSAIVARAEAAIGPQLVDGRVTIDGIPLRGIETRSFHAELGGAIDGELAPTLDVRARIGIAIDGLYPAGHASTRAAPYVELAVVLHL